MVEGFLRGSSGLFAFLLLAGTAQAQTHVQGAKVVNTARLDFEGLFTGMSRVVSASPLSFEGLYVGTTGFVTVIKTGPLTFEGLAAPSTPMTSSPAPANKGVRR